MLLPTTVIFGLPILRLLGAWCQSARMVDSICRVCADIQGARAHGEARRPMPRDGAHVALLLLRRVSLGIARGGEGHAHDLLVVVNEDPAHRVVQLLDVPADIVGGAVGVFLQHVGHAVGIGAEVADIEDDLGIVLVFRPHDARDAGVFLQGIHERQELRGRLHVRRECSIGSPCPSCPSRWPGRSLRHAREGSSRGTCTSGPSGSGRGSRWSC